MASMKNVDDGLYVWGNVRSGNEYSNFAQEMSALTSLDLSSCSDTAIKAALNKVGHGYVTRVMWSLPKTAFKARRGADPENLWTSVSQLWSRPAAATTIGRFNRPRKPMLYLSGAPGTAVMEVGPRPFDYVVILMTRVPQGIPPIHAV